MTQNKNTTIPQRLRQQLAKAAQDYALERLQMMKDDLERETERLKQELKTTTN